MVWKNIMFYITTTIACMTNRKKRCNETTTYHTVNNVNNVTSALTEPIIIISKGFYKIIKSNIYTKQHNFYLYLLRFCIHKAKNINDLIKISNFLASKCNCLSADDLTETLVLCFKKYPITEVELQQFSIWQQMYVLDASIYGYVTTLFWICILHSIQERELH